MRQNMEGLEEKIWAKWTNTACKIKQNSISECLSFSCQVRGYIIPDNIWPWEMVTEGEDKILQSEG